MCDVVIVEAAQQVYDRIGLADVGEELITQSLTLAMADCALAFDKQLNKVDLPTLGSPTIPHCSDIYYKDKYTT